MGMLCFVLDLRSLSPALLRELKQVDCIGILQNIDFVMWVFFFFFEMEFWFMWLSLPFQSLLQLANYYAIYSPVNSSFEAKSKPLLDRIGLCYIFMDRNSCSAEVSSVFQYWNVRALSIYGMQCFCLLLLYVITFKFSWGSLFV